MKTLPNGTIVVTEQRTAMQMHSWPAQPDYLLVLEPRIADLERLVQQAKKKKKRLKKGGFFVHLSPNVSFFFNGRKSAKASSKG